MQAKTKNIYSNEIKHKAIDLYINKHYGYKKIARILKIPSATSVKNWVRIYKLEGSQELDKVKLGGHERRQSIQYPKPRPIEGELTLEKEVEWLRAENAYLKKLEALVANKENRKPRL